MATAAVDIAFMITLMEQSYREEEEMCQEAEAERKKSETNAMIISGDAKKGAGLFKVYRAALLSHMNDINGFHRLVANSATPLKKGRTRSVPACTVFSDERQVKSMASLTPTRTNRKASLGRKTHS
jgi:hypothetical protein